MLYRFLLLLTLTLGVGFGSAGCSTITSAAEERMITVVKDAGDKLYEATKVKVEAEMTLLVDSAKAKIGEHLATLATMTADKIGAVASVASDKAQANADAAKAAYDKSGSASDS